MKVIMTNGAIKDNNSTIINGDTKESELFTINHQGLQDMLRVNLIHS